MTTTMPADARRIKLEARRLTWLMRCILRAADEPGGYLLVRPHVHSARILERRGFARLGRTEEGPVAILTPAGAEVLRLPKRVKGRP